MLRTRSPIRPLSLADRDDALDLCSRDLPGSVFVAARILEGARTGSLMSVLGPLLDSDDGMPGGPAEALDGVALEGPDVVLSSRWPPPPRARP